MKRDFLIVGAGLFGATCARVLADAGKTAIVVDRRDHIGGNCYDELIDGIYVNSYGGHIFHTNSKRIWDFANRFAEFRQYEHRVKISYRGHVYSFPPNLATFEQIGMLPSYPDAMFKIRRMFFDGYNQKQWGRPLHEIPESVINRIPIRYSYDDRYFSDIYQGIPEKGYTNWIENMLGDTPVQLGVNFVLSDLDRWRTIADRVIYSGALDELFTFDLGNLEFRSLSFRTRIEETDQYVGVATMNYPDIEIPFTKIMEWKNFGWSNALKGRTIVTEEYPEKTGDPYYPVETPENLDLQKRYAEKIADLRYIKIGGRLGSYRYLNMDQIIGQAIAIIKSDYV